MAGLLCLAACGRAGAAAPAATFTPEPTFTPAPTPPPAAFDTSSLRFVGYTLRQTGGESARLRTEEEVPCATESEEISLLRPLTLRMAPAEGLGRVVLLESGAPPARQALAECAGLTFSGNTWPDLTVEESYALPLTLSGGSFGALTFDGGEITVRQAYITGEVRVRSGARVTFENCLFDELAVLSTAPGAAVTADGRELSAELPVGLAAENFRPGTLEAAEKTEPVPVALIPDELVTILPPPPVTPAPEPTSAPEEPAQEALAAAESGIYYLKINVETNTVNLYLRDEDGAFTVPYAVMLCSTGHDTPRSGVFLPGVRHRWQALFGDVYGQYTTQITGNILFHSVPYLTDGDPGSLEYWEFDKLGTTCSMGCVRLTAADARWIYENADAIAGIEFYADADPGPMGKPAAPLIGWNEEARGWDPTDDDERNPWLDSAEWAKAGTA